MPYMTYNNDDRRTYKCGIGRIGNRHEIQGRLYKEEQKMNFRDDLNMRLKDPEFAKAYAELAPEYEIIEQMIQARNDKQMTQKDLAAVTGIPQGHISRIETGNYNPSLAYLKRIAKGLGKELHIELK